MRGCQRRIGRRRAKRRTVREKQWPRDKDTGCEMLRDRKRKRGRKMVGAENEENKESIMGGNKRVERQNVIERE